MTARPALALVAPSTRAGRRALDFIGWAIDKFGRPDGERRVVIARSLADLTRASDKVDSEGTVGWYIRQLRQAGVVVSTRPIVVDLDGLQRLIGTTAVRTPADKPASAAHVVLDEDTPLAELQARVTQLHADLATTEAAIARVLICGESSLADQEGKKVDLNNPPSFLISKSANSHSRIRESDKLEQERENVLALDEIDEIVEPLRELCLATGRPTRLDTRGKQILARLGRARLCSGVRNFCAEIRIDTSIHTPMGVFIRRAEDDDPDTFSTEATLPVDQRTVHDESCQCEGHGVIATDASRTEYKPCPDIARSFACPGNNDRVQ